MQQIGIRYPELLLRRNNPVLDSLKKYFTYVGAIKRLNDTSILTPTYPIQDYFGFYSWDMKSKKKDLIFRIGLNIEGFCLAEVYEVNKRLINKYSTYNLCSLPYSERRRLRKYYVKRFEEEIIPLMKPYFEEYKKRKQ